MALDGAAAGLLRLAGFALREIACGVERLTFEE